MKDVTTLILKNVEGGVDAVIEKQIDLFGQEHFTASCTYGGMSVTSASRVTRQKAIRSLRAKITHLVKVGIGT